MRDALFGLNRWFALLRNGEHDTRRDEAPLSGEVVADVPVRVVELTGRPGGRGLHAPAPPPRRGPQHPPIVPG